ncbi:MAG TPA: hypothetical protein VNN07_13835 [Candidatus Tectomicrobia bacterium]|nr:hypothetical protein [Candidatus Tectomicrobia bacterium]
MTAGMFVVAIVLGLLTGWVAGRALGDGGHGRGSDLVLGLLGSGVLTSGVALLAAPGNVGSGAMAGFAILGAALLILTQRRLWPA